MSIKQMQEKLLGIKARLQKLDNRARNQTGALEDKSLLVPVQLSTYFDFSPNTPPMSENWSSSSYQLYAAKQETIVNGAEDIFIDKIYYTVTFPQHNSKDGFNQTVRNVGNYFTEAWIPAIAYCNFSWNLRVSSSQRHYMTKHDGVSSSSCLSLGRPEFQRPVQFRYPLKIKAGDSVTVDLTPLARPSHIGFVPTIYYAAPSGFGVYFSLHGWRNGEMA